jgi:hypothetical protein
VLASVGEQAAAELEVREEDETRRPAKIFLVIGSDSKSSESLLLLLMMLLLLTALQEPVPQTLAMSPLRGVLVGDSSTASTGEQGSSGTTT